MTFLSIEFAVLLAALLVSLFLVKNRTGRKYLLLAAGCVFYAWWDWRLFLVMAGVTILNYAIGSLMAARDEKSAKRHLLWLGLSLNFLVLGYFKYAGFFVESLESAASVFGLHVGALEILAPLGISFLTFEAAAYLIDIYSGASPQAASFLDFAVFISFFPRVASGPIMRARNFLPQLEKGFDITPENFFAGLQIFLRGLLKKVVVADNAAILVDHVYTSPSLFSSGTVWLGVLAYSVQILCDFSGYTDMAIGIGRMVGFQLPENFNLPYTSQSVTEFWQRWHITLSTWFRDYLFYPLERARKRKSKSFSYLNLLATMLVCGLWHGAGWNFILWGGLLGFYMVVERMFFNRQLAPKPWTSPAAWLRAGWVYLLISLTWIPFRSPDWDVSGIILRKLFFFKFPYGFDWYAIGAAAFVPLVFIGGLLARRLNLTWQQIPMRRPAALAFLFLEILAVFYLSQVNMSPFIYSQF